VTRGAVLVLLLTACGEHGSVPVDAPFVPGPVTYRLSVGWAEPMSRPQPSSLPTIFIDGVARDQISEIYARREDTVDVKHVIELRAGDAVLRTRTWGIDQSCLDQVEPTDTATEVEEGACAYWSGDLRFGGVSVQSDRGFCVGDGFCIPDCGGQFGFPCPDAERCTSRASSTVPLASHLACAPVGPKQLGEACALIADAKGALDDCGKDLLCVDGTCRSVCMCNGACADGFITGQPPELMLCAGQ